MAVTSLVSADLHEDRVVHSPLLPAGGRQAMVQELSKRWSGFSESDRLEIKKSLVKETALETKSLAKEQLATPAARQKYLQEFCKDTSDQVRYITIGSNWELTSY